MAAKTAAAACIILTVSAFLANFGYIKCFDQYTYTKGESNIIIAFIFYAVFE